MRAALWLKARPPGGAFGAHPADEEGADLLANGTGAQLGRSNELLPYLTGYDPARRHLAFVVLSGSAEPESPARIDGILCAFLADRSAQVRLLARST
jgi:hypothetical protein